MAQATLVFVGNRRLRYLIASEGPATISLPTKGGASPDLLSDSVAGPLRKLLRASLDGYGFIQPGPLTREQAQAMLLGGILGNQFTPSARPRITNRTGLALYTLDADVDRDGGPQLVVTVDRAATAYLDVEI